MQHNVIGHYVAVGTVWHYIPKWRTTEDWLLKLVEKAGPAM